MELNEQRRLSVPCSFKNVRRIAAFVRDCCSGLLPEGESTLVELAVVEAANNVVSHSYRDSEGWPVEIAARYAEGCLDFLLSDRGLPFKPECVPEPSFDWKEIEQVPEHGRGLFLIKSIMDDSKFLHKAEMNLTFLRKRIGSVSQETDEDRGELVCDLADPFSLISGAAIPKPRPDNGSNALARLIPELSSALSLQTEPEAAYGRLAESIMLAFGASSCAIRLKKEGSLELCGKAGEAEGEKPFIDSSEDGALEFQAVALGSESFSKEPDAKGLLRLCLPLTGIGRLLGVVTLSFREEAPLLAAKESFPKELSNFVSVAVENQLLYAKALDAERSKKEMETAANLHKGIISMLVPNMPNLLVYAKSQPALEVSGDYLSFHKAGENVLWFMICDAMGKGMSASFFSILSHMTFQSVLFLQDALDPGSLLTLSNRILSRDFDRFEMFMTALVGKIDSAAGTLSYASAGHCPPILQHPIGGLEMLDTQDFMLGVDSDLEYKTYSIPFTKGMRIVAYTDGLTDIVGPDGEMVGVDPLVKTLSSEFRKGHNVLKACETVFSAATVSSSKVKLQDDITLVGIECC